MDNQRNALHDASDRYLAAVAAAGQAVYAVTSGMGVEEVGIEASGDDIEERYKAFCTPRRYRGVPSTLNFLVAGQAAQVALNVASFIEIDLLDVNSDVADLIRSWDAYWEQYPYFFRSADGETVEEVNEEIRHLIWLTRWQMRRRFRYEPEMSAIQALALLLRDRRKVEDNDADRIVRLIIRERS